MNLKLKNIEVKYLAELIGSLTLKGKKSRWRTALFKLLSQHYIENVNKQLNNLATDYMVKDENDKPIYVNKEKTEVQVYADYFDEEKILLNEEYIIECNESNKIMILSNAEILLDGDFDVPPEIATMYDSWCEKFEEAIEYYNNENNKENK